MSRRNRETLRHFFRAGALPSQEHFGDLIDSTLNMTDEGFNKSPESGLEIVAAARQTGLLTFFRDDAPTDPLWRVTLDDQERRKLQFWDVWSAGADAGTGEDSEPFDPSEAAHHEPVLTLGANGHVGIGTADPTRELDVNGYVRSRGREGVIPDRTPRGPGAADGVEAAVAESLMPVYADGGWHNVTGPLDGCHALEVVAGVGLKRTGRYALAHAIAVNTFHPNGFLFNVFRRKKPIRVTQGYYRSRPDRLAFQWLQVNKSYYLQVRTLGDYGLGPTGRKVEIRYHITELWADFDMSGSWDPPVTS